MSLMNFMSRNVWTVLMAVVMPMLAVAQESVWHDLRHQADSCFREGHYAAGIPIAERALKIAGETWGADGVNTIASLDNLGKLYRAQGRYADAEPVFRRSLEVRERVLGADHPYVAVSLVNLGENLQYQSRNGEAEKCFKRSVAILEKALGPEASTVAIALQKIADLCRIQGRYGEAESLSVRVLAIAEKSFTPGDPHLAAAVNNLGLVYLAEGRYVEAEPLFKRAVALLENTLGGDHPKVAAVLASMGVLCSDLGRYEEAEQFEMRALRITEQSLGPKHPEVAVALSNLATLQISQDRFVRAEGLLKRALAIWEKNTGPDHPEVATPLVNLSQLYKAMGRYADAERFIKRALTIQQKGLGNDHPGVASAMNNLASLYSSEGRFAEAESLYNQALVIYERAVDPAHPSLVNALSNLGLLYFQRGRYAEAESLCARGLDLRTKALGPEHPEVATSMNNLASVYVTRGRYAEAETLFQRALQITEKAYGTRHSAVATSLANLATLYSGQGRFAEAEVLFMKEQKILLHAIAANFPSLSEREKTAFYGPTHLDIEYFNSFAIQRMRQEPRILGAMFNSQLATKALLLDATSKVNRLIRNSGDSALVRKFSQWTAARGNLSRVYALTGSQRKDRNLNVDSLEGEANEMEKELSLRSEAFKAAYDRKLTTWQDVQAVLKSAEAAVELVRFRFAQGYWTDTVYYAALILTPGTTEYPLIVVLGNGSALESRLLAGYRQTILHPKSGAGRGVVPEPAERESSDGTAEGLYAGFWGKIDSVLGDAKRVYFAADGVYNNINIETLRRPDGRFVGEAREIVPLISTRDLVVRRGSREFNGNSAELFGYPQYNLGAREQRQLVAGIRRETGTTPSAGLERGETRSGDVSPLPGTEEEVKGIDSLLRGHHWQSHLHMRQEALEERVKSVENPRVLHIATHGFFRDDAESSPQGKMIRDGGLPLKNPLLRSGLLLAGAERTWNSTEDGGSDPDIDDGILTAYEAMNMNLDRTELVVLSACETGLGEVHNGEGVYGLQRAFQVAGARYVLMSLWKVDDRATQELMRLFYEEWMSRGNTRDAFRVAQRRLREMYPAPYYWGAFVMVGFGTDS